MIRFIVSLLASLFVWCILAKKAAEILWPDLFASQFHDIVPYVMMLGGAFTVICVGLVIAAIEA